MTSAKWPPCEAVTRSFTSSTLPGLLKAPRQHQGHLHHRPRRGHRKGRGHLHRRRHAAVRDRRRRPFLRRSRRQRDRPPHRQLQGHRRKSTVPVYTNEWIRRVVERNGVSRDAFDVVSNPEFLREGTAVEDFLHPDRIVVGADSERAAKVLSDIYAPLTDGSYYKREGHIAGDCNADAPPPLLLTSTKSAEIIKHASNAFLAMKISFINAVSNLCEAADANVEQVARGIGLDSRIGPKFLRPGIGYGGSCFPKDVAAFRSVAQQMGVDFNLLTEVENINVAQKKRFLSKVRQALWTLRGKRLAVLGLAFKGDTDDIRESPAIDLVEMLLDEGCCINAFDPAAMERTKAELPPSATMVYADSVEEAVKDADALLILTDWSEFSKIDLKQLHANLRYPIVIDGRNLFDPVEMSDMGFTYLSIGRPTATPMRERRKSEGNA